MKNIIIGMKAWSLVHGEGRITSYNGETIVAQFGGNEVSFTHNGRLIEHRHMEQILFFSKPTINALTTPPYQPQFKHNEQIIVSRNHNGSNGKCIQVGFENEFCVTTPDGKDYPKNEHYFFRVGQPVIME